MSIITRFIEHLRNRYYQYRHRYSPTDSPQNRTYGSNYSGKMILQIPVRNYYQRKNKRKTYNSSRLTRRKEYLLPITNNIYTMHVLSKIGYDTSSGFYDLDFYMNLYNEPECIKVDLCAIKICLSNMSYDCNICSSIQATYKSTFSSNKTKTSVAPSHRLGHLGIYDRYASYVDFILQDGEYLVEIRTYYSEFNIIERNRYVQHISLITNRRWANFGGYSCYWRIRPITPGIINEPYNLLTDWNKSRIIAFVGTSTGGDNRRDLGTISIGLNWGKVGHLICLRALLEQKRATQKGEQRVERFIMNTSEDIFRRIVSFI